MNIKNNPANYLTNTQFTSYWITLLKPINNFLRTHKTLNKLIKHEIELNLFAGYYISQYKCYYDDGVLLYFNSWFISFTSTFCCKSLFK